MAETVELKTESRQGRGTRAAQKVRARGLIPAVLYGHKEATVSLALPGEELLHAIRHGSRVVDLHVGGATQAALISEVQWDHLGKDILHVDFKRVDKDERIRVHVPLELKGVPPGLSGGGVLEQPLHTLHIECMATAVPDSVRVLIGELQIGGVIHVRDLHLPEGVTVLDDPDAVVVQIKAPAAEPEAAAAAAPAAGPAEPEVIGRKAAEEGEGEEDKG
jgi:large subunit ribosomal protein L25